MRVNLAEMGRCLEEIGALLADTKIHLFEFGEYDLNFEATFLSFIVTRLSFSAKISKSCLFMREGGVGLWDLGHFGSSVWAKKSCD